MDLRARESDSERRKEKLAKGSFCERRSEGCEKAAAESERISL